MNLKIGQIILFESNRYFVLNKPPAMHSVMRANNPKGDSIAKLLLDYNPIFTEAAPKPIDGGLVNRLDFETSGVMIAAKDRRSWSDFKDFEKEGVFLKTYLALVEGSFPDGRAQLEHFLGSRYRRSSRVIVIEGDRPPPKRFVRVSCEVLAIKPLQFGGRSLTVVEVKIERGARHQIRAQLAASGHPLAGDLLYGAKFSLNQLGIYYPARFVLHGFCFSCARDLEGLPKNLTAPVPEILR
ncbi:MAG TPA: RNA pseudouridine synthase [Oligoflexia bacterium]|nr:RNA pseudouridine synthase [Oligoflexia bacterium]HMP27045.1 RNA pseudouridine synthase [Oligoflexia bacterium]